MVHKVKKLEENAMASFRVFVGEKGNTYLVIHDSIVVAKKKPAKKGDVYMDVFDQTAKQLGGFTSNYKKWAKTA